MATRTIYRKWYNGEQDEEHFLLIKPNSEMTEIVFQADDFGKKVIIFKTHRHHAVNDQIFRKYKEVCSKTEYMNARKKAIALLA